MHVRIRNTHMCDLCTCTYVYMDVRMCYVYMHVYMHVCMYACMYVCMHVCMYVYMYVCMYVCIYVLGLGNNSIYSIHCNIIICNNRIA